VSRVGEGGTLVPAVLSVVVVGFPEVGVPVESGDEQAASDSAKAATAKPAGSRRRRAIEWAGRWLIEGHDRSVPVLESPSMTVRWYTVVVDCRDVAAQARWWADVLDWTVVFEADDEVVIAPPAALDEERNIPVLERSPGLVFVPVPEGKELKNRLHIDLAPVAGDDQAAEVARLESLGARRVDVGQNQDEITWVVLADPEGNEFCVLSPRD
jgi:hypothetical protein